MYLKYLRCTLGFPGGSDGKESTCNAGDPGLIPELGSSPGEGNGCPLQYLGLENPLDREAYSISKSWTHLERLIIHTYTM